MELVLALLVQQVLGLLPVFQLPAALAFAAQELELVLALEMVLLVGQQPMLLDQPLEPKLPLGLRLFVFDFDRHSLNITSSTYKIILTKNVRRKQGVCLYFTLYGSFAGFFSIVKFDPVSTEQ
jgi:hypothetical protein